MLGYIFFNFLIFFCEQVLGQSNQVQQHSARRAVKAFVRGIGSRLQTAKQHYVAYLLFNINFYIYIYSQNNIIYI